MQSIRLNALSDQELIIPEHPDITGEVDKLLERYLLLKTSWQ